MQATFTAAGVSASISVAAGASVTYESTGTFTGYLSIERSRNGGQSWERVTRGAVDTAISGTIKNETTSDERYRFRIEDTVVTDTPVTGTAYAAIYPAVPATVTGAGTKANDAVQVSEVTSGIVHKTTLDIDSLRLTVPNADANLQGIGAKVYDFPEGRILILGAVGTIRAKTTSVVLDTLNGGKTCKWGVGSTVGVNKTLATTEQDIIPVTSITSSATINVAGADSSAALAASAQFDGTTTPLDAFLNFSVPTDGDLDADATVELSGRVIITWINLGDYI